MVLIDSTYEAVSFQIKFFTAVVASAFGRCYPFVILLTTEISVFALLFMARRTDYSNVLSVCLCTCWMLKDPRLRCTSHTKRTTRYSHGPAVFSSRPAALAQLNAVRFGGLVTAAACGLFGLRVLWLYRREGTDLYDSLASGAILSFVGQSLYFTRNLFAVCFHAALSHAAPQMTAGAWPLYAWRIQCQLMVMVGVSVDGRTISTHRRGGHLRRVSGTPLRRGLDYIDRCVRPWVSFESHSTRCSLNLASSKV